MENDIFRKDFTVEIDMGLTALIKSKIGLLESKENSIISVRENIGKYVAERDFYASMREYDPIEYGIKYSEACNCLKEAKNEYNTEVENMKKDIDILNTELKMLKKLQKENIEKS